MSVDHSTMKLGRKAVKTDSRTLRLARYLTPALPAPPKAVDWTKGIRQWGMMLNDRLGDCTIAGCAHAVQTWSANLGAEKTIVDADVQAAYEYWDGYRPNHPETDQGGVELDVLTRWRQDSLAGHRLLAFADPTYGSLELARQTIALFGGAYIGIDLPLTAQTQDEWGLVSLTGSGAPGSWGGHCVWVPAYDEFGFTCVTWGALKRISNAFWSAYVDEIHALLGADWLSAKGAPNGFDLAALQADLAAIR